MLAKRFISFFQYDGSDSAELSLPSFEKILLDCTVTAVTSAHIKKKLTKTGAFFVQTS